MTTEKQLIKLYYEYINDFLTIEKMAEYYNITTDKMRKYIAMGRLLSNNY